VFEIIDQNLEARSRRAELLTSSSKSSSTAALDASSQPLKLEGVCFTYASRPDAPVLRNVSVTVQPRSFTCFAGKSGAGKSTLVAVLSGLLFPQKGRISLGDTVLLDCANGSSGNSGSATEEARWLHANVGVVQQHDKSLMSGSIRDNIEYGKVRLRQHTLRWISAVCAFLCGLFCYVGGSN
jgi:ABC-type multidrug transport system fused ATPase/permease subunit